MSDTIKAVCECKELSETELVVGVEVGPFSSWGGWTWIFNILMTIITGTLWLIFVFIWCVTKGCHYECQLCEKTIPSINYR